MKSKQGQGSKGSGLPVGWGWREEDDYHESIYLYAPGNTGMDYHGAAYTDGSWTAYPSAHADDDATYHDANMSAPRSPEALAAGQREVEDVLRRAGVFGGVGEVDAVRAPAEPASRVKLRPPPPGFVPPTMAEFLGYATQEHGATLAALVDEPASREPPAPPPYPTDPEASIHIEAVRNPRAFALRQVGPPAPAPDAELARLLPGLPAMLTHLRERSRFKVDEDRPGGAEVCLVVDACELLLGERERMAEERRGSIAARDMERRILSDAVAEIGTERDALRARVAELEAQVARSREQDRPVLAGLRELEERLEPLSLDDESALQTLDRVIAAAGGPLAGVVAEVMAVDVADAVDGFSAEACASLAAEIALATGGRFPASPRARMAMAAAVLLAGMLACDAAAKGGAS